jgi:hypothetical protein
MSTQANNGSGPNYSMSRILIATGGIVILIGLLWPYIQKLNLFHLPGDIVVKKEHFSFYFPITTSIILSIVLSLILWLVSKLK